MTNSKQAILKNMTKRFFKFWFPAVVWMGLIFWASSFHTLRASPINWQDLIIRKTAHFLEYVILFFLFFRGFKNTTKLTLPRVLFFSFICSVLYAVSDEFHQTLVDGRSGMVRDIVIDSAGVFSGWLLANKTCRTGEEKKI